MDTAMYITCVLSVDSDQAFGIKFTKDTSIAQLKQDIHKERPDWLSDLVPAVLKLYLIHSVDDDQYIEGTSKLPDQNCIPLSRPTKTLGDYVGDRDLNTVYVFVAFQPPQPAAQRAETEELKALRTTIETLNNRLDFYEKNRHKFSIVVEPKHKAITWDVDISTVTLDDLSRKLSNHYPTEYDHVGMFVIKSDKEQYPLTTDEILQSTLRWLINVGKTEFKVGKANPAKPFSDYDLGAIVQLYGLSDNEHPDQSVFPEYTCGREPLKNPALIPLLQHVLGIFDSVTPLKHSREATHSLYVHVFLALTAVDFKTELGTPFSVIPEKYIEGLYGRGPVDYAIDLTGGLTVGITEVKKEDFDKGIAQNAVQIASALEKKRKRGANDIDGSNNVPESCFGIVTNAKEWKFLRCTRVGDDIKFELSKSYTVSFGNETGDENIKEVAERIKWLFMEAQSTNTPASDGTKRVKLIHPASEVEYLG